MYVQGSSTNRVYVELLLYSNPGPYANIGLAVEPGCLSDPVA